MVTPAPDVVILTDALSKVHNPGRPDQVVAVGDVSLHVGRGEVVVLQGPSGSGKTTLLSLLGCMTRPTSGSILIEGRNVAKLGEMALTEVRRRAFGFIFQQYNLIPDMSVLDNVMLPLVPLPVSPAAMRDRADAVLAKLDLTPRRRRRIHQLSGGEQQRAAIARALINNPTIIVADEPTAHLDRKLAVELMMLLEELNRDGTTVIIATHDPLVYEHSLVDRSIAMRDGRMLGPGEE